MYNSNGVLKRRLRDGRKFRLFCHHFGQTVQNYERNRTAVKTTHDHRKLPISARVNQQDRLCLSWRKRQRRCCIPTRMIQQHSHTREQISTLEQAETSQHNEDCTLSNTDMAGPAYTKDRDPVSLRPLPDARTSVNEFTHASDSDMFSSGFVNAFKTRNKKAENRPITQLTDSFTATRPKIDLSYVGARQRESASDATQFLPPSRTTSSEFRANTGIRQVLGAYMRHIEPLLRSTNQSIWQSSKLDYWLMIVFSADNVRVLQKRGYSPSDVALWSWVLSGSSTRLCVRRYLLLSKLSRDGHQQPLPLFMLLQILRSASIDKDSINLLVEEIELAAQQGDTWGNEPGAILLIRILRHARLSDVSLYERVARLAPSVLPIESHSNLHSDTQRLSHFYNRFLSLLALPVAKHPFLSVGYQQRAQLKIARSMMESKLNIPLNREGYRALARLQLMHEKTVDEQKWSSVKAPSWPPWRRDQLGIDAKNEYPGRNSRVAKVIRRLLEAGYGPESIEKEAQILAGWDTDKSPTVQTRRILKRRPLSWLKSLFGDNGKTEPEVDHHIWAAKVAATRSVREAWVCFYSYLQATMHNTRQLRVYHEMFHKLFARTQQTDQQYAPFPGDGKEVFPDPLSPRDLVYVPKEPPSIDELYAQMLQDGLQPAGRLLASLLDSAQNLAQGFDYIQQSTLSEVKKDVLLHPENYPHYFIRNVFNALPDYLLASYIGLLTKRFRINDAELYWPGSRSTEEVQVLPRTRIKPLHFGMALLQIWGPKYMPAYHAILESLCTQAMTRRSSNSSESSRQHSYRELWKLAMQLMNLMKEEQLTPDLICFRKIVVMIRNNIIRAPNQFVDEYGVFEDAILMAKSTFIQAVDGRMEQHKLVLNDLNLEINQQPFWKDIEALLLILGFNDDFVGIIDLLKWIEAKQKQLDCIDDGSYKMQRLMCATRVAMEPRWLGRELQPSKDQLREAKQSVRQWGWPQDIDVEEFLKYHLVWIEGMKAATKLRK